MSAVTPEAYHQDVKRSKVDQILATIDVGLQTAEPDPTFGEVSPEITGQCWRCELAPPAPDSTSGVCPECRIELLAEEPVEWEGDGEFDAEAAAAACAAIAGSSEMFRDIATRMAELWSSVAATLADLPPETREALARIGREHMASTTEQ